MFVRTRDEVATELCSEDIEFKMAGTLRTTEKGDSLEIRIRDLLQSEINADRFWAKKDNCKVHWKKGYESKDRGRKIIFDVSVEIFLPGAKEYSVLVLIECKNYSHPVQVDDLEEFFSKVQQVAAANASHCLDRLLPVRGAELRQVQGHRIDALLRQRKF
jgi:hypothetical protein